MKQWKDCSVVPAGCCVSLLYLVLYPDCHFLTLLVLFFVLFRLLSLALSALGALAVPQAGTRLW